MDHTAGNRTEEGGPRAQSCAGTTAQLDGHLNRRGQLKRTEGRAKDLTAQATRQKIKEGRVKDLTAQAARQNNRGNKMWRESPQQDTGNKGDRRWPGVEENADKTQAGKVNEEQKESGDLSHYNLWQQYIQSMEENVKGTNEGTQTHRIEEEQKLDGNTYTDGQNSKAWDRTAINGHQASAPGPGLSS